MYSCRHKSSFRSLQSNRCIRQKIPETKQSLVNLLMFSFIWVKLWATQSILSPFVSPTKCNHFYHEVWSVELTNLFFFFWDRVSLSHPGWNAVVRSQLTAASTFPGAGYLPTSASLVAGTTGSYHHTRLNFVFFIETGFCHVAQAFIPGLKQSACLGLPTCWDYRRELPCQIETNQSYALCTWLQLLWRTTLVTTKTIKPKSVLCITVLSTIHTLCCLITVLLEIGIFLFVLPNNSEA